MVMRTVKQVSEMTGISVRTLQYYDEIGLFEPSKVTEAGYRLYDDAALEVLQQILFFKELDFQLKDIKRIMQNPGFDKHKAFEKQQKFIQAKRDRLDGLLNLLDKLAKGEKSMSFTEFDMSEYFNVLEEFKTEHQDKIIKYYGSVDKYNEFIEKCRSGEDEIAKMAVKKYGSIEKYAKAMKKNLNSSELFTVGEQYDTFKKDCLEDKHPKLEELFRKLVSDVNKDPSSIEMQGIAEEITNTVKRDYDIFKNDKKNDKWYYMVQNYLLNPEWIKAVDKKYGEGASRFIGEALNMQLVNNKPRLITLYKNLASDLSRDPSSTEIQEIIKEIADITNKNNNDLKIDEGENYWGYTADLYWSDSFWIKITDKKYGSGASKFIGEAMKFYAENNKH